MSEMNNIAALSVSDSVEMLSELFVAAIDNDIPFSNIPSPMLWGPPGVGKSDAIKQIANVIREDTGKKVNVTDVRLLLFNPVDLRGIPVANESRDLAVWLKPKIFDMDSSDDVVNILFLDEISAAPQSVQAAAYQITLDRVIGEHRLPDNCIVIAAGNRTTDRSVAYRMPNALANRLMHIEIKVDFESWAKWAITNNVNPLVLGYLSFDRGKLNSKEVELDQVAFTTPRSWMHVSNILNIIDDVDDIDRIFGLIAGCISSGVALEFIEWCKTHSELPDVEDIFRGKRSRYPARNDALYTLVSAMVAFVDNREKSDEQMGISVVELENACAYASGFPADYQTCLYSRLCRNEKVKTKLMNVPGFKTWINISRVRGI